MKKYEVNTQATAGTLESSDIHVMIDKNTSGIVIDLKSSVENQYGRQIRKVIAATLEDLGIENAKLTAVDQGALDCTVRARVITAVHRANGIKENYDWEEINSWTD